MSRKGLVSLRVKEITLVKHLAIKGLVNSIAAVIAVTNWGSTVKKNLS